MFQLDPNAAKANDVKSATIQTAGKYKGQIVCAEYVENAQKGSKNIRIVFKSDEGQEASFFINMIYRHSERNDGGNKLLSAILACLKLRDTGAPAAGTVEKWNADKGARENVAASVFPALAGRKIGLLIQMEIEKNSEKGYPRPTIYMPFEYETEKTASEVLANPPVLKAEILAKAVQVVADRPVADRRPKDAGSYHTPSSTPAPAADEFDDDIPF